MERCQPRVEIKLSCRRRATSGAMIPANLAALQPPFFDFPTEDGAPSFGLTPTKKVVSGTRDVMAPSVTHDKARGIKGNVTLGGPPQRIMRNDDRSSI